MNNGESVLILHNMEKIDQIDCIFKWRPNYILLKNLKVKKKLSQSVNFYQIDHLFVAVV